MLNKQSQTADEGWSSSVGVGWGVNNSSPYKRVLLQKGYNCLRPGLVLWCNL